MSSTCYDLREVRDGLVQFIEGFGFHPMLSDRGDVFYHPDLHTHDSCLSEVGNCDMFILIIGGRFGGEYKEDPEKSIVNAEYEAARQSGIPVFTFIKRGVYSDHHVFTKNRSKEALAEIEFPSVEKPEHAARIFKFIDIVRGAPVNNGIFEFDHTRDMQDTLRSQWAGLFFDFLAQRKRRNDSKVATNLLESLSLASSKVEDLLESVYRHIDKSGADSVIRDVSLRAEASAFFKRVCKEFRVSSMVTDPESLTEDVESAKNWAEYLDRSNHFSLIGPDLIYWSTEDKNRGFGITDVLSDDAPQDSKDRNADLSKYFAAVQKLSRDELEQIIRDVFGGA